MAEKVYVVQRIDWEYNDEWYGPEDEVPIKAFRSRAEAERYCHQLEVEARAELTQLPAANSWWSSNLAATFGARNGYAGITSLSTEALEKQLQCLGIADVFEGRFDFGWWDDAWQTLTTDQLEAFWSLFDRLHFYQVVDVDLLP